jgi:hypothetical protein
MSEAVASLENISLYPRQNDAGRTCTLVEKVEPSIVSAQGVRSSPGERRSPRDAQLASAARGLVDTVSVELLLLDQRGGLGPFDTVPAPTSAWHSGYESLRAPAPRASEEPSLTARGRILLQRAREAATNEVQTHLAAGREVYGRRDGKPVVIKPKR